MLEGKIMKGTNFCQLWLSCKDAQEADKITNTLLVKHLIACAKQISVPSTYWWKGKLEQAEEVILLMESRMDLFNFIEAEVAKLHSYDTFVLEAIPISRISKKATTWLKSELKNA